MPDIAYGTSIRYGASKKKPESKPRRTRSNVKPPPESPSTDPVISNLESLVDVQFKPIFSEIYARGHGNITAFASDFLNVSLTNPKNGQRHDAMERWWHTHPFATERHLTTGNRWGKSLSEAIKLLHHGYYQIRPPEYADLTTEYTELVLSLTVDMSRIIYDYAVRFALDSKMFSRFVVKDEIKTAPFPILVLGTPRHQRSGGFRSEIWARSSSKDARYLLGRKFDFIVYDECSRDPHGDKVLDEVLRMRLADRNGRIDMVSTAAGKNWFWLAFLRGEKDIAHNIFYSQSGKTYENPFIDHARVKQNEGMMAAAWVEQNIMGGFVDFMNVFDRRQIEAMYDGVEYSICGDYRELDSVRVNPDAQYLMAIDWARKRDETVILVANVSQSPAPLVYAQGFGVKPSGARYDWDELLNVAAIVHYKFNRARCLYDATGMAGDLLESSLEKYDNDAFVGYDFAGSMGKSKDALILVAQQALQNKAFQFPYTPATQSLVDQLLIYDRDNDKNIPTDWVFSFALLSENLRRANLPISEALDAPFVYASMRYNYGANIPILDSYRVTGMPGADMEPVTSDKFKSDTPNTVRVLTSNGWRDVVAEEAVA